MVFQSLWYYFNSREYFWCSKYAGNWIVRSIFNWTFNLWMSLAFSNYFIFQIHPCRTDEGDCNNNNEINNISQATGIFPASMLPEITPSSHSNRNPGRESWGGEEEEKNRKQKLRMVFWRNKEETHTFINRLRTRHRVKWKLSAFLPYLLSAFSPSLL